MSHIVNGLPVRVIGRYVTSSEEQPAGTNLIFVEGFDFVAINSISTAYVEEWNEFYVANNKLLYTEGFEGC